MKKHIPPKPRTHKHKQPHKIHTRIQCNPKNLVIAEYLDTTGTHNQKHIYLFPQKKQLTHEERENLALSMLATLPRYNPNTAKPPIFLTHQQRTILKLKWKKYKKWRKQHL